MTGMRLARGIPAVSLVATAAATSRAAERATATTGAKLKINDQPQ